MRDHRVRESVHGVLRLAQNVVVELGHDADGPEDLLAHDLHVRPHRPYKLSAR